MSNGMHVKELLGCIIVHICIDNGNTFLNCTVSNKCMHVHAGALPPIFKKFFYIMYKY